MIIDPIETQEDFICFIRRFNAWLIHKVEVREFLHNRLESLDETEKEVFAQNYFIFLQEYLKQINEYTSILVSNRERFRI